MNATDLFSPHDARPGIPPARVPWIPVAAFLAIAAGLGWLVCLPLWLGDGLGSPLFPVCAAVLMATPTLAALAVTFATVPRGSRARYLGLIPFRPVGRKIALFLFAPVALFAIAFGAMALAHLAGWSPIDPGMTALAAQLQAIGGPDTLTFVVVQFVLAPVAIVQATVLAFGEELGWRGYLTTALAPLGFWPSAAIIGVVWGLWHAPVILLGYNFARPDAGGLALMCVFTLLVGVLLQWTRYATRSVWPAAVAHGALNTAFAYPLWWASAGADPLWGSAVGIPGWILLAATIVILVLTRAFRPAPDWTPRPDPRAAGA
ncbi:type II CAAX prenyl endopeptidase Rce1 family protein [Microbacterium excoecariae]|uniref:CPBP family glutamic-type intramembrane protease n=1 Tax=Microbacterium excoecariae TaxID=2715210 RepID=UPI00140B883C|nr:CPBP family intramembrane metalloprotease [Microbacterium excoecariae]